MLSDGDGDGGKQLLFVEGLGEEIDRSPFHSPDAGGDVPLGRDEYNGQASASFYSLIETAKANGLEPSRYLKYLFEKFPYAKTSEDVFNLLPMNISDLELKK